jgi:hypothetical protein
MTAERISETTIGSEDPFCSLGRTYHRIQTFLGELTGSTIKCDLESLSTGECKSQSDAKDADIPGDELMAEGCLSYIGFSRHFGQSVPTLEQLENMGKLPTRLDTSKKPTEH